MTRLHLVRQDGTGSLGLPGSGWSEPTLPNAVATQRAQAQTARLARCARCDAPIKLVEHVTLVAGLLSAGLAHEACLPRADEGA